MIDSIAYGQGIPLDWEETIVVIRFEFGRTRAQLAEAQREIQALQALQDALDRAQAIVEFDLDGVVIAANDNFCAVMDYRREEILGRHHRIFVDPNEAAKPAYAAFWQALKVGHQQVGECRRMAKGGREVWLQANYSPVLDRQNRPCKVVKYASDITQQKWDASEARARIEAIASTLAVIDFHPDGTIIDANSGFCRTMDYPVEDVRGRHHRMFVTAEEAGSAAYRGFWEALRRGESSAGTFVRIARDGHLVHLRARYHPIRDAQGHVVKVVKYAVDISEQQALQSMINELQQVASAAQAGDLSTRVDVSKWTSGVGAVGASVNQLLDAIGTVVGTVRDAAADIHLATSEIASGNADLSRRTEQAAASVEETAAAIEEVAATMRQNADNAAEASSSAQRVSAVAGTGGQLVTRLTHTMTEVRRRSRSIMEIISMIDSIAFQTNILALNAAVEAARAGEQGRGFAVVAGEVRGLAKRSATAAREVKTVIEASVREVDLAAGVADQAGATMAEVVEGIRAVDARVATISQASREQSAGIDQISQAVTRFGETTQQNAALVEQATAATEQLLERSNHMEGSVARFRLRH